jgi:hypothetical protein
MSVYICRASRCMCWVGNSGSWRVWGKNRQEKAFWVPWRGELETTDLGSGTGMHSSVYPYCYGFWSLGVGVLLALGGYKLAPVWNRVDQLVYRTSVHTTPPSVGLGLSYPKRLLLPVFTPHMPVVGPTGHRPAPNGPSFWNVLPMPMRINLNHKLRSVWSYGAHHLL